MGFRFSRRIRLAPGLSLNLGKTGGSLSFGPRGAKITLGSRGIRKTLGLPGTGLSYTSYSSHKSSGGGRRSSRSVPQEQEYVKPVNQLDVGFFSGLFMDENEKRLVESLKEVVANHEEAAIHQLRLLPDIADAAYVLAVLAFNRKNYDISLSAIADVRRNEDHLGEFFKKYNLDLNLYFAVTDLMTMKIYPNSITLDMLEAEIMQQTGNLNRACEILKQCHLQFPDSLIVKISLAELILTSCPGQENWLKFLLETTEDIENESQLETLLLYYRGLVLKQLKLYECAAALFSTLSRRKKNRDHELMTEITAERARLYELQGKQAYARRTWEKVFTMDPDHEEARKKLLGEM